MLFVKVALGYYNGPLIIVQSKVLSVAADANQVWLIWKLFETFFTTEGLYFLLWTNSLNGIGTGNFFSKAFYSRVYSIFWSSSSQLNFRTFFYFIQHTKAGKRSKI